MRLLRVEVSRESEVGQLYHNLAVLGFFAKQVLWLQVSVHDVQTVHVVERQAELLYDRDGLELRELALVPDHVKEVATADELHDDVVAPSVLHQFKDARDVRVHSFLEHIQLVLVQLLVHVSDHQAALADDLDCAWHTRLSVLTKLDSSEGPAANLLAHLVVSHKVFDLFESSLLLERKEVLGLLLLLLHSQPSL